MKTVIPFKVRNERNEQAIIYHGKDIAISKELRLLPEYLGGRDADVPVVEREVFVIRLPRDIKKQLPSAVVGAIRSVGYYIWQPAGDKMELLLIDNTLTSDVFVEMAKAGLIGYSERLSPTISEGLYLPYYRYTHRSWQKPVSVLAVLLSIPQASWMMHKERQKERLKKEEEPGNTNEVNS